MYPSVILFNKHLYPELSNFWYSPLVYAGLHHENAESAFQAQKTLDVTIRRKFCNLEAAAAKRKGRSVDLRPDWEECKYSIMNGVVYAKFSQNPELAEILLSTGDAYLVEDTTSWHDNVWGNCNCSDCRGIPGGNGLGIALMLTRDELRKEREGNNP